MADTIYIENGQTIDELDSIPAIKDDAYVLICSGGITYKMSIADLRKSMVGDSSVENKDNLFYSCNKIDDKLQEIKDIVTRGSQLPEDEINNKIDTLQNNINSNYIELLAKINDILSMIS